MRVGPVDLDEEPIGSVGPAGQTRISRQGGVTVQSINGAAPTAIGTGAGGLALIETKTLVAAATTLTFSSLLGDTDGVYALMLDVISGSAAGDVEIRLNAAATNHRYAGFLETTDAAGAGAAVSSDASAARAILGYYGTAGQRSAIEATILAKTGAPRMWNAEGSVYYASGVFRKVTLGGVWTDTAAQVTSIALVASVASGFGIGTVASLYRVSRS